MFQNESKTFQLANLIAHNSSARQISKGDQENLINFEKDADRQPMATIKEELR